MSDSFADLWSSTAPSQPQKPVTLSQQQPSYSQPKPKQDVFALLSQSSTPPNRGNFGTSRPGSSQNFSSSGSRPITPSLSIGSGASRPGSSLSSVSTRPNAAASSSSDAFNDLFSGSFGGASSKPSSSMTIAERAALAEKQRLASSRIQSTVPQNHHQWAGLDALGGGSFGAANSSSSNQQTTDHDDWGLGDFGAPTTAKPGVQQVEKTPKLQASDSLLDFEDFGSQTAKKAPSLSKATPSKSGSLWDLDDFTGGSSSSSPAPQPRQAEKFDSPDFDFDFGNREDRSRPKHDEDDILGDLSRPVQAVRSQSSTNGSSTTSSVSSQRPTPKISRSSSPPPHILGQIVEMGFSLHQAKYALAKTETGTDVQAALEMLLGGDDADASSTTDTRERPASEPSPPPQRRFNYDDEDDDDSRSYANRRRQQAARQPSGSAEASTPNIQEHADKILNQASEIGLSVLTKASLFWNQGKEKVQKAYEERAGAGSGASSRSNGLQDSRPKWMQEAASHLEEDPTTPRADRGTFRDDHDEEGSAFRDRDEPPTKPPRPQRGALQSSQPPRPAAQPEPEVDLFNSSAPASGPSEPKVYVSPYRRKKPTVDPVPSSLSSVSSSRPAPAPAPAQPKPKRRLPSCQEMTLDIVREHKTKGTEAFKLGQFSVAAEEYSKAITLLPDGHALLVPLYTNRSLARIRCGECKSAVDDSVGALSIISCTSKTWETWNPTDEGGGWELEGGGTGEPKGGYGVTREKGSEWSDAWGRGIDLKDGWIKAVRRRAEALEGMEKWSEAKKDWEILTGAGWVDPKTRDEAVRGLGRCKKMLGGSNGAAGGSARPAAAAAPPRIKPRPRPALASNNVAPSGEAVKAYRAQVSAMEAEDALKHQLKDTVEAKLLAWKKGKETNLRALLASLDIILWEEVIKDMGGKPGMADLVSSGGVKKWYMKSVARVHPDKLNTNNSSVEQRMIAGGVFGTLNEAWLAFKP